MKPEDYLEARYGAKSEWFNHVPLPMAKKQHAKNVGYVERAWKEWKNPNRPLRILAIAGSGRNRVESCAKRESNSKMLMMTGLEPFMGDASVEVDVIELREVVIEPCNGCYSTTSTFCHAPCTCFPFDGMNEHRGEPGLYAKTLRADVLLMSTGVNQSMCSTRIKAFMDRLISMDGGVHIPADGYRMKDEEWLQEMMSLAASGEFAYSPRLATRVCGFFITSKDQENELSEESEVSGDLKYKGTVAYAMKASMEDYGCVFPGTWYAWSSAQPHVEMMYDPAHHSADTKAHKQAREVVRQSVVLAREVRKDPARFAPMLDRMNRT